MAIADFQGNTFVAFLDISGFKDLMRNDKDALLALKTLYQAGYDILQRRNGIEGFFVSDSGILFVRSERNLNEELFKLLDAIKFINSRMLESNYMLTTSIAYGYFDYHGKLEFDGIEKNPIYGNAYVNAFLDNEKGSPKLQPGECRLLLKNLPIEIDFEKENFSLLKTKGNNPRYRYFYWNLNNHIHIEEFEKQYNDSYKLKYAGMLGALKQENY